MSDALPPGKGCPGAGKDSPIHSLLGAAHYWHGRYHRLRWWRLVAVAALLSHGWWVWWAVSRGLL